MWGETGGTSQTRGREGGLSKTGPPFSLLMEGGFADLNGNSDWETFFSQPRSKWRVNRLFCKDEIKALWQTWREDPSNRNWRQKVTLLFLGPLKRERDFQALTFVVKMQTTAFPPFSFSLERTHFGGCRGWLTLKALVSQREKERESGEYQMSFILTQ